MADQLHIGYPHKHISLILLSLNHWLKIVISLPLLTQTIKTEEHKLGDSFVIVSHQDAIVETRHYVKHIDDVLWAVECLMLG